MPAQANNVIRAVEEALCYALNSPVFLAALNNCVPATQQFEVTEIDPLSGFTLERGTEIVLRDEYSQCLTRLHVKVGPPQESRTLVPLEAIA
ncbi:hypothetical protein AB0C84_45720 [Actinomadura sp. NPDC048955]|uniref:hypothetical protein n=1 Tax=Actinomadura sp. NPDC048955 TaxID=3158228 RepID=UPI00340C42C2